MCDVLFITPNLSSSVKHEINGTMILGTILLADGFDVKILRYSEIEGYNEDYPRFIEDFVAKILAHKPRCVSFYTIWTDYHIVLRLCEELKKRDHNIPLIIGGPQGSALAVETLQGFRSIDYVCTGEGENTVVPFFRRLLRNEGPDFSEIPGLYFREDGQIKSNAAIIPLSDLESLPVWDDRLLMEKYTGIHEKSNPYRYYMPVEVGRGCPFNCTFCSTSSFWRRTYRLKRPEQIIKDIRYFHDKFGYKSFLFSHDALTANEKLVAQLCDKIVEEGLNIHWECTTRNDCLSRELLVKMKEAGLKSVHMGIETGSERMQKITKKNLNLTHVRSVIKTMLDLDFHIVLFFIFGFPEETEEDFNQTLSMIFDFCDLGVPNIQLIMCMFTPDTPITKQNYDRLVFEPDVQSAAMSKFGCAEEMEMIRDNKPLFTSLYHLHNTVRDNYPFAKYLSVLYQKFPKTARYVRHFYHGDYLKFYRDFHDNNAELINMEIPDLERALNTDPLQVMLNTIKDIQAPHISQARELLRFESDLARLRTSPEGTQLHNSYGFRYYEYALGCSIEELTEGTSEILLTKKRGQIAVKLTSFT